MRSVVAFFLIFCWGVAEAQQLPIFTQYRENLALLNPAILHVDHLIHEYPTTIGLTYRNQWAKLSTGPKTFTARFEHLPEDMNMVFGGAIIADNVGPNSFAGVYGRYAYQAYFSSKSYLSGGIALGMLQYRFDPSKGVLADAGDAIGSEGYTSLVTDVNAGLFYNQSIGRRSFLYLGGSLQRLPSSPGNTRSYTKASHYYGIIGAYLFMRNSFISFIEPSVWYKQADGAPPHIDFNFRIEFSDNLFWVGTGCTYFFDVDGNRIAFVQPLEVGVSLGEETITKLGFAYKQGSGPYSPTFGGAFEFNVTFAF